MPNTVELQRCPWARAAETLGAKCQTGSRYRKRLYIGGFDSQRRKVIIEASQATPKLTLCDVIIYDPTRELMPAKGKSAIEGIIQILNPEASEVSNGTIEFKDLLGNAVRIGKDIPAEVHHASELIPA